ncbi:MAG: fumarylacetoacetate hydrolase family protein [Pseudomonadota bacterium]
MKLVRFGEKGAEKPGMIDADGALRDLSAHVDDINGAALSDESLAKLAALNPADLPAVSGGPRMGACVGDIGKFVCIGLNFTDHAEETGNPIPEHPIVFMKANSAISGPFDDIVMPRGSTKTDWEVELGVVIGREAKYVSEADALDYVAGYCVCNDVSERTFQIELSGQWTKGKSCDTFGPTGPWMVTKDEIADINNLEMWCDVNGKRMQSGSTKTMIFNVAQIVSHLSELFTLHPGDVISTGTPPGVGMGMKPPLYLKAGDEVSLYIEGLGTQTQKVVANE